LRFPHAIEYPVDRGLQNATRNGLEDCCTDASGTMIPRFLIDSGGAGFDPSLEKDALLSLESWKSPPPARVAARNFIEKLQAIFAHFWRRHR